MSPNFMFSIGMAVILTAAIVFLTYQIMTLVLDYIKLKNKRQLRADIEAAILNGTPSWSQIRVIESTYHLLTQNALKNNLNELIKSMVVSGSQQNTEQLQLVESWLESLKSDEPFDGILPELKLPLERIRNEAPEQRHLVELLVSQLQEFSEKSTGEKKRKNVLSILSLLFGIAGFLVGAYQVYDLAGNQQIPNNWVKGDAEKAPRALP